MKPTSSFRRRLRHCLLTAALSGAVGCGFVGIDLDGNHAQLSDPTHTGDAGAAGTSNSLPRVTRPGRVLGRGNVDAGQGGAANSGVPDSGTTDADAGAVPDAGATATDAGTSDAGAADAAAADGGPSNVCAPTCGCSAGTRCDLSCGTGLCAVSCAVGSDCRVDVGAAPQVTIDCAAGATCRATGANGPGVVFVCTGPGDCTADCGSATACSITCSGTAACSLNCQRASTCDLTCEGTSTCLIKAPDGGGEASAVCADQIPATSCSDQVLACNTACP